MAKDQRNVEAITPMEEDFAKWYTDICLKAELVDYASVKDRLVSTDMRDVEGLFPIDTWLTNNLIDVIKVK